MAHLHNINTDIKFYIDPITRAVKNESGKGNLIQYDHYAVRYGFELPRFVEGHDMTLCDRIEIHYINFASATEKSEDLYLVDDIQVSPSSNYMAIFSWLLSANATKYAGSLNFLIRFVCLDGENVTYSWSTDIFKDIKVGDGMNNSDAAIELSTDILEAWRKEVLGGSEEAAKRAEEAATKAEAAAEEATERVEEAVKFATDKVEDATNEAADRAEAAAEAAAASAEAAAESAEDAVEASTTFDNRLKALEQWKEDKEYVAISITSFSATKSTYEMGETVTSVTLNWQTNKTPTSLTFDGASIEATATSKTLENLSIKMDSSKKSWTLVATDERGKTSTKTAGISFLNGVYYGVAKDPTESEEPTEYDSSFILGLSKQLLSSKLTSFTATAGKGEYFYYCLPTRMGECIFTVGVLPGGFNLVKTLNFTNASGYSEYYYIYRSNNANLGNKTVKVS